jgi:hypothetical protein
VKYRCCDCVVGELSYISMLWCNLTSRPFASLVSIPFCDIGSLGCSKPVAITPLKTCQTKK